MGLRAGAPGDVPGLADRDALDRLDRDDRLREAAVEPRRPSVTCEPSPGTRPKARTSKIPPSDSFAFRSRSISSTIASPALGVEAADRRLVDAGEVLGPERRPAPAASTPPIRSTWLWTLTPTAARNAFASPPAATRAAVSRALARSSTLRTSRVAELEQAGEVGVAGPRQVDLLDLGVDRPRVHPLLPVRVVAVGDQQRDRAAERAAVADPRADLDRVLLDLHPAAAAVTELAPRHVAVERLAVDLEPRGQALDDRDQPGAVRFARRREVGTRHAAPG